jgi:hypothetical protein
MIRAWWVGNDSDECFEGLVRQLVEDGWLHRWRSVDELCEYVKRPDPAVGQGVVDASHSSGNIEESMAPHVIVISRSIPSESPMALPGLLRSRFPLTPLVCVLGPWCGGIFRRNQLWPATIHLPWQIAPTWFSRQYELARHGRAPDWSSPFRQRCHLPTFASGEFNCGSHGPRQSGGGTAEDPSAAAD